MKKALIASPIFLAFMIGSVLAQEEIVTPSLENSYISERQSDLAPPFGDRIFASLSPRSSDPLSDPNRKISPGDRMVVRMWGAQNAESVMMVEADGSIFIPEVGPVQVAGKPLSSAQKEVENKVSQIYSENVGIHTSLLEVKPISVFVTGNVNRPGRFEGSQVDSLIDYIARADGIDPVSGSYRKIAVKRGNEIVVEFDLYGFLKNGEMPVFNFLDNDTIVVQDRGMIISVVSGARNANTFEFKEIKAKGSEVIDLAKPAPGTTHVMVTKALGSRDRKIYVTLQEFANMTVENGDQISFGIDRAESTMQVTIEGEVMGQKTYSLAKAATLKEVLSFIKIDPDQVDVSAIHIERKSVAEAQRKALDANLFRLQQVASRTTADTAEEAQIRTAEAQMISNFVKSAEQVTFPGKVVVSEGGKIHDIRLEDGDVIVIPSRTDIVLVHGEIMMSNAFLFDADMTVIDYIARSGGFLESADTKKFIVNHIDGSTTMADANTKLRPGDEIFVLPKIDEKNFLKAKDIISVLYQVAVGANILLKL